MHTRRIRHQLIAIPFALFSAALLAQSDAASYSDAKIDRFAGALDEVMELRQEYSERMKSADDRETAQEVQREANEKMMQAVRDSGLTLDEYNEIAQAAANSEELNSRIDEARD